jgi:hypothetical protein
VLGFEFVDRGLRKLRVSGYVDDVDDNRLGNGKSRSIVRCRRSGGFTDETGGEQYH